MLSVFDISQTEPIEGAEQPTHPAQRLTGDDPAGIFEAMAAHMRELGWCVTREPIAGETNGYTTTDGTQHIVIEAALAPAQAAKTMIHEAAHAILHAEHVESTDYVSHRGLYETEAESVAYVLAGLVGLDTSAYSVGYITTWTNGDIETVKASAANVLLAVHQLASALIDEPNPTPEPGTGTEAA